MFKGDTLIFSKKKHALNNDSSNSHNVISSNKSKDFIENLWKYIFLGCASIAILSIITITIFIFAKGSPAIFEIGVFDFLFSAKWKPSAEKYGIFAMIIGSIYATIGAITIGVPIGIFTAVFLAEIAPDWLTKIMRPSVELLAGIPSVVYGFFGLIVIVPIIDSMPGSGSSGSSLLAACIILGIMILPTIISITETSLRSVPKEYKEGALAIGASHMQTIFTVMIPAAKSGILTGVILGIGRAIGETMAVILVCGNTVKIPLSIFDRFRPMTANIALEMSYAFGLHQEALLATGVILFIFIMILNLILNSLTHKVGDR
ncbi:phosphate ABC transporter permease subunit PstC [Clostridium sediminicola]|uniref:phosphate ABC transporter permease subunit PstC n=1 Tax=Clostridium sediminicola TaxID=3114879 RepID=UPI0031F2743C